MNDSAAVWASKLHIRWMIRLDLPRVLQLAWESGIAVTEEDILAALRQRHIIGSTCEKGEEAVGCMLYELHPKHLHIRLMAGSLEAQTAMIRKLQDKLLSSHRRNSVTVSVCEYDEAQHRLYAGMGFTAALDGHEYLFTYRCSEPGGIDAYDACTAAEDSADGLGDSGCSESE